MASDESMNSRSYISVAEDEDGVDEAVNGEVVVDDHDHRHPHTFSRLSMCTSSFLDDDDDDDDGGDQDSDMRMYMSRLSIESFDGDVEDEIPDHHDHQHRSSSSDSDKEVGCYSLPATPPRQRNRRKMIGLEVKGYASENELGHPNHQYSSLSSKNDSKRRRKRATRMRDRAGNWEMMSKCSNGINNSGGESEGSSSVGGGGGGVVVITKPKGGRRSLCMDLEEVKACRDLGFELEHQRMMDTSYFSLDTASASSGANSPNWRISSPGDDPRDVKARLKVWAQAVAFASAARHSS